MSRTNKRSRRNPIAVSGYLYGNHGRDDISDSGNSHGSIPEEDYQPVSPVLFKLYALCSTFCNDLSGNFILYRFGAKRSCRMRGGSNTGISG